MAHARPWAVIIVKIKERIYAPWVWTRHWQKKKEKRAVSSWSCWPIAHSLTCFALGRGSQEPEEKNWAPSEMGRFRELREKSTYKAHLLGLFQSKFSRLVSPLLSFRFMEKDTCIIFLFLFSIIFRANLDPNCDQELRRVQVPGVEKAWRGSWVCG